MTHQIIFASDDQPADDIEYDYPQLHDGNVVRAALLLVTDTGRYIILNAPDGLEELPTIAPRRPYMLHWNTEENQAAAAPKLQAVVDALAGLQP